MRQIGKLEELQRSLHAAEWRAQSLLYSGGALAPSASAIAAAAGAGAFAPAAAPFSTYGIHATVPPAAPLGGAAAAVGSAAPVAAGPPLGTASSASLGGVGLGAHRLGGVYGGGAVAVGAYASVTAGGRG